MIDKATGTITLSSLIQIKHNDHLQDIRKLAIGKTRNLLDFNDGWIWLHEQNVLIDNLDFAFQFGFFNNRLQQLSFCFNDRGSNSVTSWNDWSKEVELANLKSLETWLNDEIGEKRDFNWGNIWASYDAKACASSIGLKFKS